MAPKNDKTANDSPNSDNNSGRAPDAKLWWIFVTGGILFVALLFGSIFIPNLTERVKFFTANALSLSVLVAIGVQAYIYRRQWEVMKTQADSMRDGLEETRSLVAQNERAVRAAEQSSEIAQQNMIYAQRANIGISNGEAVRVGADILFRLKVENSGHTPAYDVQVVKWVDVKDGPPAEEIPEQAIKQTKKQTVNAQIRTLPTMLRI